jgi:hypothetical protein
MKIHLVEIELSWGQTERHDEAYTCFRNVCEPN